MQRKFGANNNTDVDVSYVLAQRSEAFGKKCRNNKDFETVCEEIKNNQNQHGAIKSIEAKGNAKGRGLKMSFDSLDAFQSFMIVLGVMKEPSNEHAAKPW